MAAWLLDTNHVSPLVTYEHPLRQRVLKALNDGDEFWVAVPSVAEVVFGIGVLPRAETNLLEWRRLKHSLQICPVDGDDAEEAALLRITLRRRGFTLSVIDAMIAVVAIRNRLVLLTTDKDFLAVPELEQRNWLN